MDLRPYKNVITGIRKNFRPSTVAKMPTRLEGDKTYPNQGWVPDPSAKVSKEAKAVAATVKKQTAPKKNAAKELLSKSE